ncbi:MAG: chromosome segregation protein SMC [Gammaproteobacteria bacterium]|nr:MAG: chromosome segregation protein SMC [Gammaproteobacteria bacterium]
MRLKNISLSGFKSFVDPTKISFPSSMSGVVGPNGCGKSNIIDAVRWVMGEISAKNLRGESMADVIFNGSSSRAPSSRASVELLFNNDQGRLGGEYSSYSEISVKRVLDLDGKSTYSLNGSECRRKDITDIFLGTGLGPRSYAVIEQEMATKLISSKPEELRAYIEEVAGISIYRERKKETESRIKKTRENLNRVSDLRDEIERTLVKLNQQVKSAEKYNFLKEKEKKLNGLLKAFSWQARNEAASKLDLSVKQTELEIEKLQSEKQTLLTSIETFRAKQNELQLEIDSIQEDFYSSGANLSKSEQQLVFLKEKKNELNLEIQSHKETLLNIADKKVSFLEKMEKLNFDLAEKEPQLEKMDASISKLDGAMSPVFILKQILIEQSNLMNSVKNFKLNFDSKTSEDLNPIIVDLEKFEEKLSRLNEILEKQEDYQEEKFLAQKNDLLSLSGEITNLKVSLATISSDLASFDEQEHLTNNNLESCNKQLEELTQPISDLEKDMKPLLDSRANVEGDLSDRRTKFSDISEQIRQNERKSHEVDISIEKIRSDSQDSKLKRQGYISEAEIYFKQLEKDDFILEELLKELDNDESEDNLINEISKIESSISRIGPINLAAAEEYKIEEERKNEIESQFSELEKALTTLQNAIKKIDLESKTKFKDTLDQLNLKVGELFPKLFGGGHASLELTSEDLLEAGVLFRAMPPGKKNVNVSQLSGGEKALSAIALVFSFFALNPAPFCILDEVDAPLDDFNAARFISMVEEMSDRVQFIFVTHNKISMEKSKHLLGVTMQEPGVSRLVSVDVDEAMKLAAI